MYRVFVRFLRCFYRFFYELLHLGLPPPPQKKKKIPKGPPLFNWKNSAKNIGKNLFSDAYRQKQILDSYSTPQKNMK